MLTQFLARLVITLLLVTPLLQAAIASAQTEDGPNPHFREHDEAFYEDFQRDATSGLTPEEKDRNELLLQLNIVDDEATKLESAFGTLNDAGELVPGSLGALKLKPADKQRLIKLLNGSATDAEKERYLYDQRVMDLLIKLTTPKSLGGYGFTHIRVGDLLRFRQDPKSRETEGADNISQHQHGKAVDIIEINKTHCTKEGLFSSSDLPSFPVKVIWQGGTPYNPSTSVLGAFDAVARANAFRDILGALPGESYHGSVQGLEDLLQQLQRRVIANELQLPAASLDYVINDNVLETLGRVMVTNSLNLPPGALTGATPEAQLRSIPTAFLEQEFNLPPTSLQGDDWNAALERLGRMKVAYDIGANPQDILQGNVDAIRTSAYYTQYKRTEAAFRLAPGTLDDIRRNRAEGFRKIGAQLVADRLKYSEDERNELIAQAGRNEVKQLSLARYGDIKNFPGPVLPLIAPAETSSKAQAETYLANLILGASKGTTSQDLPAEITQVLRARLPKLRDTSSYSEIAKELTTPAANQAMFMQIGARAMEQVFSLPTESLSRSILQPNVPLETFQTILGQRLLEDHAKATPGDFATRIGIYGNFDAVDAAFKLPQGTTAKLIRSNPAGFKLTVGKAYFDQTFRTTFNDFYHVSAIGLAGFTPEDMLSILKGDIGNASTRAGASWVEEDLGLTPGSFAVLLAESAPEEKLVNAGIYTLGGEIFEAYDIDARGIDSGDKLKQRLGQARIETALGLTPGSFRANLETVQQNNTTRFAQVFARPSSVDTILGLDPGTTDKFLKKELSPDDMTKALGGLRFEQIKTEDLQDRLGWDSRFKVDGEKLLRMIESNNSNEMRTLLSDIGSFNADYVLGYDPGTFKKWAGLPAGPARDAVFLEQGSKLYAERMGFATDTPLDILNSYRLDDRELRNQVSRKIKARLEAGGTRRDDSLLYRTASQAVIDELEKIEQKLNGDTSPTARTAQAQINEQRRTLTDASNSDDPTKTQEAMRNVQRELRTIRERIGNAETGEKINETRSGLERLDSRIETEIAKILRQNNAPVRTIDIPLDDAATFINGDMWRAVSVVLAANQAKSTPVEYDIDIYKMFRAMFAGSSNDPSFDAELARRGNEAYAKVLRDLETGDTGNVIAKAFDAIVKGTLTPTGGFNPNASPYPTERTSNIKSGFFVQREAQDTYYYGLLDSQIRKRDPSLPRDFVRNIMSGSNEDRSRMINTYLGSKLSDNITDSLPANLQGPAKNFLQTFDPESGKFLATDAEYARWGSTVFANYTGVSLPPAAIQVAIQYTTGTFNPNNARTPGINPGDGIDYRQALTALSNQYMALWVEKSLGMVGGQLYTYYQKFEQVNEVYQAFKAGNLGAADAFFAVDRLIFDGALTSFVNAFDDALGLPAGSSQLLLRFALTGDPTALIAFAINLFFGSTIECPDLQVEAQRNVKQLISAILDIGETSARLIPSQIITWSENSFRDLQTKVRTNYWHCLQEPQARCGVFARPEYAKQVHIGF